jgi:threonine/homoserine/homoserine lactone efflux protein
VVELLAIGGVLGFSAGISPGPLLALVIDETLRHDVRAGIRVAVSPLVTDLPIILFSLLLLSQVAGIHRLLGLLSLLGGAVLCAMGYSSLRSQPVQVAEPVAPPRSLLKGIVVNLLSPHPYLFWLTVGGPLLSRAWSQGLWAPTTFLLSFYCLLIGAKILLACLVGRSKAFLQGPCYLWTMRLVGLLLCGLALRLVVDGFRLLGGAEP